MGKWLGLKAEVKIGALLNKTVSNIEQKDGEYFRIVWRLADAGPNLWRVFGIGQNEEHVLENKVIGDKPLCHIIVDPEGGSVEVDITFRCDPAHLTFDFQEAIHPRRDLRFSKKEDLNNRVAVARCIVMRGLKREASKISHAGDGEPLALTRQKLRLVRRTIGG
jgi:hypothetical protein